MTQSNTEELKNARTATTGEIFDTLDERIDHEVDRLNKKIDVSMLQQEDKENHVIENTVEGMTTDMIVKGRTLQNLFNQEGYYVNPNGSQQYFHSRNYKNLFKTGKYTLKNITGNALIWDISRKDNDEWVKSIKSNKSIVIELEEGQYVRNIQALTINGWVLDESTRKILENNAVVLEGDKLDIIDSINYFEGIKSFGQQEDKISILSNGKNLGLKYKTSNNSNIEFNLISDIKENVNCNISFDGEGIGILDRNTVYYTPTLGGQYSKGTATKTGNIIKSTVLTFTRDEIKNLLEGTATIKIYANNLINSYKPKWTQLEYGTETTSYEPYKCDKKDILLQNLGFDEGLRGLNNSVYDELNDIKNVAIKRVGKKIITSELPITLQSINVHGIANFAIPIDDLYKDRVGFCNKLILQDTLIADTITEGFTLSVGARGAFIRVKSEKASNVEEFKQYLATLNEPIVIYYPCEPVETPLDESIALKVFNEKTYVEFQNSISGTSSFKAPVNTVDTIARLNRENRALEEENKTLRQDFESTTLSLTDSDLELVKQNVDIDFRLMEVEFALDIPQAILSSNINFKNKKGEVKSMARTPYEMMKIVILSGDYDREDYIHKVGKYYERGRMTKEEHDELMSLMTADEVISK